jgi:hypothetical protein
MIIWLGVLLLTILSYFPAIKLLAIQHPYGGTITISNLTLNLILLECIVGTLSPKITKKLWPSAPKGGFIIVAVVLGIMIVLVLKMAGMPTRF